MKISEWLMASGAEVTMIEKNSDKQRIVDDLFGSVVILGDGTVIETQKEAGTERADFFITTLASDEDNMLACQIAKHHFQVEKTLAISSDPDSVHLLTLLGIDMVVDLTEILVEKIQSLIAPMLVEDL